MKFKSLATLLTLAAFAGVSTQGEAKSLSYNQVSASYTSTKLDDLDDYNPTGLIVNGSFLLNDNVFLTAGTSSVSGSYTVYGQSVKMEASDAGIGIGYRHGVTDATDVWAGFAAGTGTAEATSGRYSEEVDVDITGLLVGIRTMLNEQVEIHGSYSRSNVEVENESSEESAFKIGLSYYFQPNISLGASMKSTDDSNTTQLGLSYHF